MLPLPRGRCRRKVADVSPNSTGLPGISSLSDIVGALSPSGSSPVWRGGHRRHRVGHRHTQLEPAPWARQDRGPRGFRRGHVDRWGQRAGRLLRHRRQGSLDPARKSEPI